MMTVTTLTDGGQQPGTIAQALHDFLAAAKTSLDMALYDFHLAPGLEELVVDTIMDAASAASQCGSPTRRLPCTDPGPAAAGVGPGGHRAAERADEGDPRDSPT